VIAGKPLQAWLSRADELGGQGRYFDAHEELELAWKQADGSEKILLQGLIQIAAGLHRLKLDPSKPDGAFYLLDRGLEKLRGSKHLLTKDSLSLLETALSSIRMSGIAPNSLRFDLRAAQRLG
jgi:predicted metal-dependent hydrolase